jgi:hypothetical protein
MALRVDPEDVLDVMPGTDLDATAILPFLEDASLWVDNYLASGQCRGLNANKMGVIEKYLAAHLATLASGVGAGEVIQAQRADISERYAQLKDGQSTRYVAVASAMEPCGIVAEHWMGGRRVKAVVGKGYAS